MAAKNQRLMQEQARLLIEREVRLHQPVAMQRARSGASACSTGPFPICWRICAPIVTVEPTLHGERHLHVFTDLALALRYGAILLTADQQLAGAAERTGCGG